MSSSKPMKAPKLNQMTKNPIDSEAIELGHITVDQILHQQSFQVGRTYYGLSQYVEYLPGNLPIIITVPHGGYDAPESIPNRVGGVHEPDINTQELARAIYQQFQDSFQVATRSSTVLPLRTPRLLIRPFSLSDAPFILRLLNERSFIENIHDKGVRTIEQAEGYLTNGPIASYSKNGYGLWMVEQLSTGLPMGMCGLIKRDNLPEADLGYALVPEFCGQGYGREAGAACLAYARDTLGFKSVLGIVSPHNKRSADLLTALGFVRDGSMEVAPGDVVDRFRVSLTSSAVSPSSILPRPHMIINRLQRCKLDMNRNEMDATGGNETTRIVWKQFHGFVRRAKREIMKAILQSDAPWKRGLCLDLHGQSHDHRNQLGYILSQQELASYSDEKLNLSSELLQKCSLRCAIDATATAASTVQSSTSSSTSSSASFTLTSLSEIVRGRASLGYFLELLGHPCKPSPTSPDAGPSKLTYFNGGYNTYVNGSSIVGQTQREKERKTIAESSTNLSLSSSTVTVATGSAAVDPDAAFTDLFHSSYELNYFLGIQLESAYQNHRDTEKNILAFAQHLVEALQQFTSLHVFPTTTQKKIEPTSKREPINTNNSTATAASSTK